MKAELPVVGEQGKETCAFCRWWQHKHNDVGSCHRYAPRPALECKVKRDPDGDVDLFVWWPEIGYYSFCGEWAAIPEQGQGGGGT